MKVLVINGDCIQVNSSANLCHIAYISGLVQAGYEVTLLSADGRDYKLDPSIVVPKGVIQNTYYGVTLYEKMSLRKSTSTPSVVNSTLDMKYEQQQKVHNKSILKKGIQNGKRIALSLYGVHGIYSRFIRVANRFKSEIEFDYILSLSTPPSSHLIAYNLIKKGNIKGKKWIQIWEDPWFSDAYGHNGSQKIHKEEKRLLSLADNVCYVSPLTLKNQQKLYPESAHKMYWQPLPYYYKGENQANKSFEKNVYGYFGDYFPAARNLEPFYKAAVSEGIEVNICGRPSDIFGTTETVHIHPRLSLNELKPIEDGTNVLIFLCNRKGGQIPGKIYQYSATDKVILFIMDGTKEEQQVLYEYFTPFNRYVFCQNNVEDISRAIKQIENGDFGNVKNIPLEDFNPTETIRKILEGK